MGDSGGEAVEAAIIRSVADYLKGGVVNDYPTGEKFEADTGDAVIEVTITPHQ